nr:hypothetical protein Itr_chr01CG06820 [Ipomoea trifida]
MVATKQREKRLRVYLNKSKNRVYSPHTTRPFVPLQSQKLLVRCIHSPSTFHTDGIRWAPLTRQIAGTIGYSCWSSFFCSRGWVISVNLLGSRLGILIGEGGVAEFATILGVRKPGYHIQKLMARGVLMCDDDFVAPPLAFLARLRQDFV